jgi:hypothetical protein
MLLLDDALVIVAAGCFQVNYLDWLDSCSLERREMPGIVMLSGDLHGSGLRTISLCLDATEKGVKKGLMAID